MRKHTRAIEESSPLFSYWNSEQSNTQEENRLLKSSNTNTAKVLFNKEPYKWEILFQSILKEVNRGDQESLKGLKVLMEMLNEEEKGKTIKFLMSKNLLNEGMVEIMNSNDEIKAPKKNNSMRFARILFSIFTNPYNIEVKRKRNHLYEHTGYLFYRFKSLIYKQEKR